MARVHKYSPTKSKSLQNDLLREESEIIMKEIYDSYVENTFDGHQQADFKKKQFANNYKMYFPVDNSAKVLDIGIGRGEMLSCMKEWGYREYLGIDISSSTVNFCTSIGLKCEIVQDTAAWLNSHSEQFDVVTVLDVLEHFPKDMVVPFLTAIRESLTDSGALIIQVPNMQSPDSQLHRYNDITHEVGYVEHSLNQVLLAAGFKNTVFNGFDEYLSEHWSKYYWKFLRAMYWKIVRFNRRISGNLNPDILHPVLYAYSTK